MHSGGPRLVKIYPTCIERIERIGATGWHAQGPATHAQRGPPIDKYRSTIERIERVGVTRWHAQGPATACVSMLRGYKPENLWAWNSLYSKWFVSTKKPLIRPLKVNPPLLRCLWNPRAQKHIDIMYQFSSRTLSRSRSQTIYFSNISQRNMNNHTSHGHGHGHGVFILATHPERKWTTNPKPSFTQYPSAGPTKGTGTQARQICHGHGVFMLATYPKGKWTTNLNPLS
jgi:hypothetical protein